MWQIKFVSGESFMSFDKVEYAFENKCYVVQGLNLDNDGQKSNGGGKTSFADLAAVALFGYSLTGRNVKNCVNWNSEAKSFTVQLFMINEAHGLDCYITRKIYAGTKGQELSILINDQVPQSIPTKKGVENGVDVREGNAYILHDILDITEDDLLNYYFISKKNYAPFLEVNTDRKLEVIGRFSKADVVDEVISKLGENVKEVDVDISNCQHSISKVNGHIEALQQILLQPAMEQFEIDKQNEIDSLNQTMNTYLDDYNKIESELLVVRQKIEDNELPVVINYKAQIDELESENQKILSRISINNKVLSDQEQKLNRANALILNSISCPKCEHKFNIKGELIPTQKDVNTLSAGIDLLKNDKLNLKKELDIAEAKVKPLYALKSEQDAIINAYEIASRALKQVENERADVANDIFQIEDKIKVVSERTFEDQSSSIKIQIEEKEKELQEIELQIQNLNEEKANIKKWMENFYDFKFELGNKPIEIICALVNQYLKLNGSDLNLFIEGFKKLKSGEIRQALNPVVYRNWNNPQALEQFSEGERVRLNLTVDLAFQQLINSTSKYGGLDFYENDELLNPLDSLGVSLAAKAFNNLNKTILLVTHSGSDMNYENTILIQKENKISRIA